MGRFARVMEHGRRPKVNELDDIVRRHYTVVELDVAVGEPELVQVVNAVAYLAEDAVHLWPTHLAGHDDTEEVVRRVLHHLRTRGTVMSGVQGRRAESTVPRNNARGRTRCRRSR